MERIQGFIPEENNEYIPNYIPKYQLNTYTTKIKILNKAVFQKIISIYLKKK